MAGYSYDRKGNRIRVEISANTAGICHSDGAYSRGTITSRRTHLMPAFAMTAAEEQQYGNTLNIWQALRLLQTYAPLVTFAQRFLGETDPYAKSIIVADAAEWLAAQTQAVADDKLVGLLADLLKTTQGEALLRWCIAQVEAIR